MSERIQIHRRAFLRTAGMTAVAGAFGAGKSFAAGGLGSTPVLPDGTYDFDAIYDRTGTDCIKWDRQIEKYGRENIEVGMGIADMDFKTAPCIGRALAERCEHENWGYTMTSDRLLDGIVAWNKERHGLDVDRELIQLSAGVHPAVIAALKTFSPPGSRVLLTTPTYNGFYGDLRWSKTLPADSPMKLENGRYSIDWDDLESRIAPDTNTLILCNPQNPTGNCWSKEDLLRLGRLCLERRVVVLADEIHCDFVMKGQKYTPFASLPDKDVVDNSITFKAISKTFSISAMKNAYFFTTNPKFHDLMKANHRPDINTLGMVANEAAYHEGAEWFDQLLPYIDANHDFVESYIKEHMPLVSYTKAQGTYLAWLDVSKVVDRIGAKEKAAEASTAENEVTPEEILENWFVANAKVQLNPGSSYGTGGAGRMRMNLGTSRKLIKLALDNMAEALQKI